MNRLQKCLFRPDDGPCVTSLSAPSQCVWCLRAVTYSTESTEAREKTEAEKAHEASEWRRTHLAQFVIKMIDCDDVQTLRALAHRIGYKEGT